jgi:predicted transposase/invertase (TIGR01784 family)
VGDGVEPIRADSMILLTNKNLILHVEFQTVPDRKMGFRMLDYRVRAHRKFPGKQMRQVVIQYGSDKPLNPQIWAGLIY